MNVLLLLPVKAHAYYDSVLFSSHSNSCHYNHDLIMSINYVQLRKNSDFYENQVECFRKSHLKKFSLKMRKKCYCYRLDSYQGKGSSEHLEDCAFSVL